MTSAPPSSRSSGAANPTTVTPGSFDGAAERENQSVTASAPERALPQQRHTSAPDAGHPPRRSGDEYAHLRPLLARFVALDDDDPDRAALRDRIIVGFQPLAVHLARRHAGRHRDIEGDLVQVGTIGLIGAIDRFRPDRLDGDVLGYLIPCIRGEMLRYFRDKSWATRVPRRLKDLSVAVNKATGPLTTRLGRAPRPSELAAELGADVGEVIEALNAQQDQHATSLDADQDREGTGTTIAETLGAPDAAIDAIVDHAAVRPLIEALPQRERTILTLRFFAEMTRSQIAERMGISQMHVSRLLSRTLAELRQGMRDADAC